MTSFVRDPQSGLPIGLEVSPHLAPRPARTSIAGRLVRLEPLSAEQHGASLWTETHGRDKDALWQYMFDAPFDEKNRFLEDIEQKEASEDPLYFAIVDMTSGEALGYEALLRIHPSDRCIEVGSILYGPRLQRNPRGTEAQYLLMRHIFDDLGYRRYEWKCNALNNPSRAAALRLGFTFEGVFRQHMVIRGRSRDTAWYSIIDSEWQKTGAAFNQWLAADNFDSEGMQKKALATIRAELQSHC